MNVFRSRSFLQLKEKTTSTDKRCTSKEYYGDGWRKSSLTLEVLFETSFDKRRFPTLSLEKTLSITVFLIVANNLIFTVMKFLVPGAKKRNSSNIKHLLSKMTCVRNWNASDEDFSLGNRKYRRILGQFSKLSQNRTFDMRDIWTLIESLLLYCLN